jgi:hypothetical protein
MMETGIDTMAVIEIRIAGAVDFSVIGSGIAAPSEVGRQIVVIRADRPAPTKSRRAAVALDYANWHARLAGGTRRA